MSNVDGSAPRVSVVLASAGRPTVLPDVIGDLSRQTAGDLKVVVAVPGEDSLPVGPHALDLTRARFVRGLTSQRNSGIEACREATHIFFFDDDAVVHPQYVENAMAFFASHPEVVAITGRVVADGAAGQAISREEAEALLRQDPNPADKTGWTISRTLYGCNFAVRREALLLESFDERLPLYGWLEDHDVARRLMKLGRLAKVDACVIVHRGVKSGGRTAHLGLGYAQVMNPSYLAYKGSFPLWLALWEIFRPAAKNLARALSRDEGEWRRTRLRGNGMALLDVVQRRFTPERGPSLR